MSEKASQEEEVVPVADWLTVIEAAQLLGVSERTLRRHLRASEHRQVIQAGTRAEQRQTNTGIRSATVLSPQLVDFIRSDLAASVTSKPEPEAIQTNTGIQDRQPSSKDGGRTKAGTVANTGTPPLQESVKEVEVELLRDALNRERENSTFLRGVIEQEQRNSAELRAALREALKMSNRALPESGASASTSASTSAQETPQPRPKLIQEVGQDELTDDSTKLGQSESSRDSSNNPPPVERAGKVGTWERKKGLRALLLRWLRG